METTRHQLNSTEESLIAVKKKFRRLAVTDSLTNLFNRRFVEQMLKQEVDRRNRYKTALAIAFIEVDSFTALTEQFGHEISNLILKDIAKILLQCSRTTDIVARFSAGVFVVLLPETTPHNALVFAERVRELIMNASFETSAQEHSSLTVCIGVSGVEVTSADITQKQLTLTASQALHTAKQNGVNNIRIYPETSQSESDDTKQSPVNSDQSKAA